MTATAQSIIEEIRVAFRGVPRGKITLHEAEEIDSYGGEEDRAKARLMDSETRWEDVPDESVFRCHCALTFLDPVSWRYYIPVYMIFTLKYYHSIPQVFQEKGYVSSASFDSTISSLGGFRSYERYQLLILSQSQSVCSFLRYMSSIGDSDAERAINDYWGQFCSAASEPQRGLRR